MVPASTPPAIVQRLATDASAVIQSPDTRALLQKLGVDAYPPMSAPEFQKFLEAERVRWGNVIRASGLKPE